MGDKDNVIITGFMGTGKTAVGEEVARRLDRPFVDMDTQIEKRAGKSIPRIFSDEGESTFRGMEAALCQELAAKQGLVIATGGGALVNPANRKRMMGSGAVICLSCNIDEILHRTSDNSDRPLLDVADPSAEIERLLEGRREAYAAIPWQIETTGLSVDEVATWVIEIAGVITTPVRYPDGEYPIHIGNGVLAHVGGALRGVGVPAGTRVAVVCNPVVAPLYGAQIEAALLSTGYQPFACSIPDGEQYKTLATVETLYDQFLDGRLDRTGTVLSLGGGVTGDVAGYAAASYMRSVNFVQVPTTLLAMVDASVGGKTGVDLPQGKNLVGAFKQPALVLIDPTVLATLAAEEMRCGIAEVVKHGVIGDPGLFSKLEEARDDELPSWWEGRRGAEWIARALRVKIDIVEEDPYESGRRAVLNLGHTVGHGLEWISDFSMRHGEAISIGMVAAARISAELDEAKSVLGGRIEAVLKTWGLPVRCPPVKANAIWAAMTHDKKKRGDALRWVLPRAIGEVEIVEDVPQVTVKSVLRTIGAR